MPRILALTLLALSAGFAVQGFADFCKWTDEHGVVHYAVTNIPGAVPHTSTYGLTNATLPYVLQIANLGVEGAVTANGAMRSGLNVANGHIVHPAVADSLDLEYHTVAEVLGF